MYSVASTKRQTRHWSTFPLPCAISYRSRASIYRHFKSGELNPVKVGNSTRIKVGELRRLIGASTVAA
ncbi:MAG: helix-turn-helix domain-containing protein [Dechloromonas sp.]|uniref:Helix-turn-helix domain-containing protein n=1 Tax=Candidatus Dechloromonas phosphorivorans TaxID=2899244 RepID=A0A935K8F0_9RHOO|nr:helix-turn-helix domain-containing protein [Candidatus Dechloromonas phosphorivorans]